MSHGPHPSISENGLADGCDRCAEIAQDPFVGLDDDNLRLLVERTRDWMRDKQFPRSDNERDAMRIMESTIVRCRRLGGIVSNADYQRDRDDKLRADALEAQRQEDGPTDDEVYNRVGVEGGIGYDTDEPGSLGENDWRL